MRIFGAAVVAMVLFSGQAWAVEIRNAKMSVAGGVLQVTYDLFGKPGERKANVKVAIVMDGERYLPGTINLVGDYGANTAVGLGKKISWNLLKDMPAGYKGVVSCEMDAEAEAGNDPFNLYGAKNKFKPPVVTESTVADTKSKLVWLRTPVSGKQAGSAEDAAGVIRRMNSSNYAGFSDWRLPKKEEFEALFKMIEAYGYKSGQSALPYLAKAGFGIDGETRLWTIDKSSVEFSGTEVFVTGSTNYGSSGSASRTSSSSSRYNRSVSGSSNASGAFNANVGVKQRSTDSGLYDVVIDTKDGYFYKNSGSERANILAVRGDGVSDIYAVNLQAEVTVTP